MFANNYPAPWSRRAEVALLLTAALVTLGLLLPIAARAQTETVLYSFTYPTHPFTGCPPGSDNLYPYAGVHLSKGHLYGTTVLGGVGEKGLPDTKDGTLFKLTMPKSGGSPWNKETLHSFIEEPLGTDGTYPCSGLLEKNGVLYGSTIAGGKYDYGTVYSLTPPAAGETAWTETILYNFKGTTDGADPFGGLTMDSNGSLYGATAFGVNVSNGSVVFQLVPSGSTYQEVTLLSNDVGVSFNGALLLDASTGTLYGTTNNGKLMNGKTWVNGYGDVFSLTPGAGGWTLDDLYDFTGGTDGAYPNRGLAMAGDGSIFGTTQGGGNGVAGSGDGVLFELRQLTAGNPYTLEVQHTFSGEPDGSIPVAGLYVDANGTFWGTTTTGGSDNLGTVFELYPDRIVVERWHYLQEHSFAGGTTDGANPQSLLTEDKNGNLYGTTNAGGSAGEGTVFLLTP